MNEKTKKDRPWKTNKPAPTEEAKGHYDTVVIAEERDQQQKNFQGKPPDQKEPGKRERNGRVETYNEKTASENQGR